MASFKMLYSVYAPVNSEKIYRQHFEVNKYKPQVRLRIVKAANMHFCQALMIVLQDKRFVCSVVAMVTSTELWEVAG